MAAFCRSHADLKAHYADSGLTFTLDGKLVGDIAEATAALVFGLQICERRTPGVDAHTRCVQRKSVQIKGTGLPKAGPAFTPGEGIADHLLFLRIDFARCVAEVAYNGPEAPIRALLPEPGWTGTKRVSLNKVLAAAALVRADARLARTA
ncbi:DUF6998 domain-containing protein [Phenylobacterium sp.]|uniref:DUF6998 domain-containing protein n=1 Tax=Phenylobacterium sp. TaxID=1871053 RepID=UPI003BB74D9A